MFAAITGLSLSSAAGLNAYIPLLVVGLLGRYTHALTLTGTASWLTNGWVLALLAVLLAAEVVLDKVAVVDSVNDMVQTLVRPAAGGAVFAATSAAASLDSSVNSSTYMHQNPWLGWVLGIGTALAVHLTKTGARPVVNASTFGFGAPVVSVLEDAASLAMSLLAILAPIVALIILITFALIMYRLIRAARRLRRRLTRKAKNTTQPPQRRTAFLIRRGRRSGESPDLLR